MSKVNLRTSDITRSHFDLFVLMIETTAELSQWKIMRFLVHMGPQIAQAAEYVAYTMAMRIITRPADLVSDCFGVVRTGTGTLGKAISPAGKFAGVVLDTHRWPFQRERVALRWVPADRKETGEEDLTVRRDIRGNSLADELAKKAVARHGVS